MDSRIWFPSLAILNFLILVGQYIVSALSSTAPNDVMLHGPSEQSDKYDTQLTPASWTFRIWIVIYVWQALWICYSMINACRRSTYRKPIFLSAALFIFNIVALGCTIAWLFLFDRDEIIASFCTLLASTMFLCGALASSYAALDMASPTMVDEGRIPDIWITRALVHNGLGLHAGWATVATLLNATMLMVYKGDPPVDHTTSGTVTLSILAGVVLIYALTDMLVCDRWTRYTVTPLISIIIGLAGSIDKNWDAEARNSIYLAVLLAVVSLLFVIKLVLTVYRHFTRRHYTAYSDVLDDKSKLSSAHMYDKSAYFSNEMMKQPKK